MRPYYQTKHGKLYNGDVLDVLRQLPDESVQCCITSPPYWGLRDYGTAEWKGGDPNCNHNPQKPDGGQLADRALPLGRGGIYKEICKKCGAVRIDRQLGLEKTPEEYIEKMVKVFREVWRVLRSDGTLWLNMGDCYANIGSGSSSNTEHNGRVWKGDGYKDGFRNSTRYQGREKPNTAINGLKPKDLIGMPWRLAFALQTDGWYLRSDIIWHKKNPMPESVTDRPTKAHEYLFLMTKSARYFYNADAIREPHKKISIKRSKRKWDGNRNTGKIKPSYAGLKAENMCHSAGRNKRTVWTISTQPFPEAHFATFPEKLVMPCVKAGTSEKGNCPMCGKPWIRITDKKSYITRPTTGRDTQKQKQKPEYSGGLARTGGHVVVSKETIGWQSQCNCMVFPIYPVILDPFMGSGTTALVCEKLNRDWIGIELSRQYCNIAIKRIKQEAMKNKLW